ncbi:mechanosensitive ion channel family protein [Catenovulum sediminis]|uniref:Mechanosensitive ion channel domain-containing protein n=1 Tax=Catenovulum sediminis TaxID=1740262 RepID=A0ABV1RJ15_9ALTE|nr:mechanosensitive ion channel domain-containing protein [Catenovulum sediminis]
MDLNQINQFFSFVLFSFNEYQVTLGQILQVPAYLFLAWFIVTRIGILIRKILTKRHVNADAVHLFTRIYLVITIAILLITTMEVLNIPITAFAFVSGAIAIGVGFGAQNIINNFISGWILMWERPIRIGDFLEVGDAKGVVECINTRSTLIKRSDGVSMLIPNSFLLENTVVNWTLIDKKARSFVRVGVAYGTDVILATSLLKKAVNEHTVIMQTPEPAIIFEDFGDNALIFDIMFWTEASSSQQVRVVKSDLRYRIYELFAENEITIAFPQRDIHLDGTVNIHTTSE